MILVNVLEENALTYSEFLTDATKWLQGDWFLLCIFKSLLNIQQVSDGLMKWLGYARYDRFFYLRGKCVSVFHVYFVVGLPVMKDNVLTHTKFIDDV